MLVNPNLIIYIQIGYVELENGMDIYIYVIKKMLCNFIYLIIVVGLGLFLRWRTKGYNLIDATKIWHFSFRLDLGKGKNLDFEECSRSKLQKQCIKYLGPVCICISGLSFFFNVFELQWIDMHCFVLKVTSSNFSDLLLLLLICLN